MALWNEWSGLQRLLALKAAGIIGSGASWAWDTVSGTAPLSLPSAIAKAIKSLVQHGKTTQASTPTPSAPVDIVCNNGVMRMLNLAYMAESNLDIGYYYNNSGVRTQSDINFCTIGLVIVKPNTAYTMHLSGEINYFSIMEYDSSKGFVKRTLWGTASVKAGDTITFTTGATTSYIRFGSNMDGQTVTYAKISAITWMLTEGATAKVFAPFGTLYTDGTDEVLTIGEQTASVADLYAVGDVADEQDIISGAVTHKIGIKVFDGSETFSKSSAYGKAYLINAAYAAWGADRTKAVMCTHFLGLPQKSGTQDDNTCFFNSTGHFYFRVTDNSDTDAFKTWLAEQYAAGTPVIVFFVLAESTTESVTAQHLATAQGDNTVSAVSNVDPVTLEVEFAKAVST